jgi:hypothetical protein
VSSPPNRRFRSAFLPFGQVFGECVEKSTRAYRARPDSAPAAAPREPPAAPHFEPSGSGLAGKEISINSPFPCSFRPPLIRHDFAEQLFGFHRSQFD